jgi:hypothetical protein
VFRLAIRGNRVLEAAHFVAENEALRTHHTFYCPLQFIPDGDVLRLEVQ